MLEHYRFQNNISQTACDVAELVSGMIVVDPTTPAGLFADGIFEPTGRRTSRRRARRRCANRQDTVHNAEGPA